MDAWQLRNPGKKDCTNLLARHNSHSQIATSIINELKTINIQLSKLYVQTMHQNA